MRASTTLQKRGGSDFSPAEIRRVCELISAGPFNQAPDMPAIYKRVLAERLGKTSAAAAPSAGRATPAKPAASSAPATPSDAELRAFYLMKAALRRPMRYA